MRGCRKDASPASWPVAAIIVTYNSAKVIEACLASLVAAGPAEILVVDNNSQDDTVAQVRAFGGARIVALASNTGFAHGCNVGVALSRAPWVLFLNDDAVLQSQYLAELVNTLTRNPQAASACGKLLLPASSEPAAAARLDSCGIVLNRYALRPLDRGHGEIDRGQYDQAEQIFGPSGAAALYRRCALQQAISTDAAQGPFDARLFAYYEDVELAWRLRRRGWIHLYNPVARATHARRGPGHKPLTVAARAYVNRYRVFARHERSLRLATYAPVAAVWELGRLARLGWRQPQLLRAIGREIIDPVIP